MDACGLRVTVTLFTYPWLAACGAIVKVELTWLNPDFEKYYWLVLLGVAGRFILKVQELVPAKLLLFYLLRLAPHGHLSLRKLTADGLGAACAMRALHAGAAIGRPGVADFNDATTQADNA